MKRLPLLILCWLVLVAFTQYRQIRNTKSVLNIESLPIKKVEIKSKSVKVKIMDRSAFLDAIGHQESGNRYHVVNRYGYMGKYQFGKSTLKTIKIKVSKTEFLNNPELQEEAMLRLLRYNKKRLQKYIDKFDGQTINGILITESGLLAAAHLGGAGSVKKWFRTGKVKKDGNGVKITSYMERFSGYNLYL
jgi:soluble lytic murein transglycosylase-like protein